MEWFLSIIVYIWIALCVQMIAKKTDTPNEWLAWIPIANLYLLCKIAGRSGWWTIGFFVPLLNVILIILWWWTVAEKRNKPGWLGMLMFIPVVNIIVISFLALSK